MRRDEASGRALKESFAPTRGGGGGESQGLESEDARRLSLGHAAPRSVGNGARACPLCGERHAGGASFCAACGFALGQAAGASFSRTSASACARPGVLRRALASVIDRLVPLPFVAYLFPAWGMLVFAYQLLCDGTPAGRGAGKRLGRLRVVRADSFEPCGVARCVVRRFGPALCQLAYCYWKFVWVAVAYELASLAFVLLNHSGRRPEDYLAGTRVVTERAYKKARRACETCGGAMRAGADFCRHCGAASSTGAPSSREEIVNGHAQPGF